MRKYLNRASKYLMALMIAFLIISFCSNAFSNSVLTYRETLDLFMAQNGWLKILIFLVFAAIYPLFGFVKREIKGSVTEYRDQIIVAMEASGFSLKSEEGGKMVFKANTIFRQISFLFEGDITVSQRDDMIQIEGIRRGVVYVVYYLEGFIKNSK